MLGVLAVGLLMVVNAVLGTGALLWPFVIAGLGIALLWRQADEAQRDRWVVEGRLNPVRAVFGAGGWASYARVGAGLVLVFIALLMFAAMTGSASSATAAVTAAARHRRTGARRRPRGSTGSPPT